MKKLLLVIFLLFFCNNVFAASVDSRKSKISKLSDEDICSILGPWTKIDIYLSEAKNRNLKCLYDDVIFDQLPSPSYENSYPRVGGIIDAINIIETHNNAYLHIQKGSYVSPEICGSVEGDPYFFAWKYECFIVKDKLILLDKKYKITRPEKLFTQIHVLFMRSKTA